MSEKSQTISKLVRSRKTREAYIRSKVSTSVASQVRALRRRQNDMTQAALACEAEMKQSRISAVERPGNSLNIETLVRLAAALKVGLKVRFVSFADMVDWENTFSQDTFDVTTLDRDIDFRKEDAAAAAEEATQSTVYAELRALNAGKIQQERHAGIIYPPNIEPRTAIFDAVIATSQQGHSMLSQGAQR